MKFKNTFLLLFLIFFVRVGWAGQLLKTTQAPKIDGLLDDPTWKDLKPFSGFFSSKPRVGLPASEETEVYLTYDEKNLYIAFKCRDREREKVIANLCRRDRIDNDDWIGLFLDTFNDQQGAYFFICNPLGIQLDGTLNQDGNGDGSLDLVWSSAGRLCADSYCVEMAIPFKSLRFPQKKNLRMGVAFVRVIARKGEQVHLPEFNPARGSLLSQRMVIELGRIKYHRAFENIPALVYSRNDQLNSGRMENVWSKPEIGLTTKFGLTSDLTLDAALNPDFSQIEADAGQIDINLRSALYFAEKRPFFLEGKDYFNFGAALEQNPLFAVFYSRQIVDPLIGLKLSGKLFTKYNLATIFAVDEAPKKIATEEGDERYARFNAYDAVFRMRRGLSRDGYLGGFYTGNFWGDAFNNLIGVDGRLRINDSSFFEFSAFYTFNRSREGENSVGDALNLRYSFNKQNFGFETGFNEISRNFQPGLGFISRTGIRQLPFFLYHNFYPHIKIIKRVQLFYWGYHLQDLFYNKYESFNVFCINFILPRNTWLRFDYRLGNEIFAGKSFDRRGFNLQGSSQPSKKLYFEFQLRSGNSILYDQRDPQAGKALRAFGLFVFNPFEKLAFNFSWKYADFFKAGDEKKIYEYNIWRAWGTYQFSRYLNLRLIAEYNSYYQRLIGDFLFSFDYLPGTVIYLGYGSVWQKIGWNDELSDYRQVADLNQLKRSFFLKISYLWRL